jgi:hypothetical protein
MNQYFLVLLILGILVVSSGCVQPVPSQGSTTNTNPPNLVQTSSIPSEFPAAIQNTNSLKYISSHPQGASIYVDGIDTGRQSDGLLRNLTPGSHTIILKLAGYFDSMQQITASPQGGDPANIQLIKIPVGSITVNSDPAGAAIYLDDTYTGKRTPDTLTEIAPGSHHIAIHRDGYSESEQRVSILPGQAISINLALKKIPEAYGNISVTSYPKRIEMYLDGESTGQMTNSMLNAVPAGLHTIVLHNPGYYDAVQLVTVIPDQTSYVIVDNFQLKKHYDSFDVRSVPAGAAIYLDGAETGKITDTKLTNIPDGEHRITLHLEGYPDQEPGVSDPGNGIGYVYAEFRQPLNDSISKNYSVSLNSSPHGAKIYLDGKDSGNTTNTTLKNEYSPTGMVVFHLDGYFDSSQMVSPRPNTTINVFAPLTKATSGSVSVVSKPAGARISLDGADTGKATNSIVDSISPGLHAITLNLPGYYSASQAIVITEGQTVIDYVSLVGDPNSPLRPRPATPVPTYGEDNRVREHVLLGTSFPEFPHEMMVYRIIPEDPAEKLGSLSKKFNISGDLGMDDFRWTIRKNTGVPQEDYELSIYPDSGSFAYDNIHRQYGTEPGDFFENISDDEQAGIFCTNYLKSLDLLPDDARIKSVDHYVAEHPLENSTRSVKYFYVYFDRKINGTRANDHIYVTVGGSGDILRISGRWTNIEPYKEMPIITPEYAFKKLQETELWGNVTSISLEYYSGSRHEKSNYVLPAYVFRGTRTGSCSPESFEYYVIAVPSLDEVGVIDNPL